MIISMLDAPSAEPLYRKPFTYGTVQRKLSLYFSLESAALLLRYSWTYDARANVTADPDGALSIAWNVIDLPRTLTTGSGTGASSTQRAYLADGSLVQVGDGTTTRLYLGDIIFNKASNGTVTLESAGWEGGRLLPGSGSDKVLYTVTDHLGSVRVVKDGMDPEQAWQLTASLLAL